MRRVEMIREITETLDMIDCGTLKVLYKIICRGRSKCMEEEYFKKIDQAIRKADLKKLRIIYSFLKGMGLA